MAKFIIQPHGRLNDWVAEEKGYFTAEGLDYELNVEGSRKNTPRLAAVDSPIPLEDNRFGAFERYAEGHGRKGEGAGDVSCACFLRCSPGSEPHSNEKAEPRIRYQTNHESLTFPPRGPTARA